MSTARVLFPSSKCFKCQDESLRQDLENRDKVDKTFPSNWKLTCKSESERIRQEHRAICVCYKIWNCKCRLSTSQNRTMLSITGQHIPGNLSDTFTTDNNASHVP